MGKFIKGAACTVVVFFIFFGAPVLVYSSFQRLLGMIPPAELSEAAIYQLATLKGLEAFILVILYLMLIERKRGQEAKYAFFLSSLLFIQGGLISELWSYLTLKSPTLYVVAGICSSFMSYGLSAWFLGKLYKTTSHLIMS